MSFKLLAIRPLKECNPNYLKNLKTNQLYKFYNDYIFYDSHNREVNDSGKDVSKITYQATIPEDLFSQGLGDAKTKINVSAIVGKNGCGKSAIVELLVASIIKMSLEIKDDFINPENLYNDKDEDKKKENIAKYKKSIAQDLNSLNVEIYFFYNLFQGTPREKIRRLKIEDNKITILDFEKEFNSNPKTYSCETNREVNIKNQKPEEKNNLSEEGLMFFKDFFYTMIINYSHYGYNTSETGEWLKGVFHKNDSYQLPIVINPFREDGNIDVNSEKYLASSRFLVNILQEKKLRSIAKGKDVSHISIEIDYKKFSHWDESEKKDLRINNRDEEKVEYLELLLEIFYDEKIQLKNFINESFYPYLRDYILLKLYKITFYKKYQKYRKGEHCIIMKNDNPFFFTLISPDNLRKYFEQLKDDGSHITDKLCQAIFLLKYQYLKSDEIFIEKLNEKLIKIDDLYELIDTTFKSRVNPEEHYLMNKFSIAQSLPSIFKVNYFFEENYSNHNFNNFSSGEKQKLYSIHSVIYHLRNLKSVQELIIDENDPNEKMIYYKNVNIIFDEIELYSHPDFQRTFLNDLLKAINSVYQRYDNLNILFITHSPFILSDIPKQNVLFLDNGKPQDFNRKNTFGANIIDLLADSFFLKDGLMGDFAKEKIEATINWLNEERKNKQNKSEKSYNLNLKDYEYHKKIVQLIDEPILRMKLAEMLDELQDSRNLQKEVAQKEIDFLKNKFGL
ncbi:MULTISPECIES: hypothetical protein [Elizabethkingia]|uniref:ATPase AAA-type core domain-containing protein n=1 Tax=Elizabethkingia meningoseptica TaxID=238 RepID=A0A1V3TZW1_ELIME|nr:MULTISPECIES: hypothetical protein [Elizabethkingia]MBG0512164.1 hypothetical protein [Elizabethkingia meningoseptica]MDE5435940.1 hypothetical protein [Elizabethkingia meningoseptica]MDX8575666.1 hypothetical protein [Elizabethkingia sp. HX WYD]OOH95250.1 hypothetical protein BMF97_10445 [Elizabethkingia meningoseptica]HAY3553685.1 hypothetical protein [Elizabethkingia meningoseptica]